MTTMLSTRRRGQAWAFAALGVIIVLIGVALFSGLILLPRFVAPTGYYYPFFFPFGFLWIFFGFFLIFGLIRFLFWPWRWGGYGRRHRYGYGYDEPYRILRERYAKGEITKEQFDQMTRDLDQHR